MVLYGPKKPLMDLIWSHYGRKRPFMEPNKVSYGPKSPLVNLIMSHMDVINSHMDLRRTLIDLKRSRDKVLFGPERGSL